MNHKTHILIVDDEPDILNSLSRHFRFLGYEVDTAGNGLDALAKLEQRKTDIVISDIMMPKMDGVDLLRQVRKEYPMTHVIMMTGYVTQENVLACMRLGAEICLFKPIEDIAELEDAVHVVEATLQRWKEVFVRLRKIGINEGYTPDV